MPFPGFMAIWCFSLISQRANVEESVSLCSPPEALFEPTSADLARKTEISTTFFNMFQKRLCEYLHPWELQCELNSCQILRHPLGLSPHQCPALLPQALEQGAPGDVPAGNQAPAIHVLVFANLPYCNCSGQRGLGNFSMMLCVSKFHRLIRHCTKAFPSGCLGFHWLCPPSLQPRRN